jgi:argininosuccinate lyase
VSASGHRDDGPLWSGRFSVPPAPEAHALGRSLAFDRRLARFDVQASIAHVQGLHDAGLLGSDEAETLVKALAVVGEEIEAGVFVFDDRDEDVHSAIERAVTERCGDVGARLHAGRSRNDLVVTDLRLWSLAAARRIRASTVTVASTLVDRAREHASDAMPGTTHARPAQPVTLGHHLLAHAWALARDVERLDQWSARTSTSPMGAGAIATSTLGIDARVTAKRLGFLRPFRNSIDATSDRDFAQELVGALAIEASHLSRVAADLARWSDPALSWAEFDDAYATGSSMMPHKRNPDVAELVRAKAARLGGDFVTVIGIVLGLPAGYHRDLQEDKEPAFDAADTLELLLPALHGALRTVRFDIVAMREACGDPGLYATDLAEALVKAGVPFREAHRRCGELLRRLDAEGRALPELSPGEWTAFGVPDAADLLDPDRSIAGRGGAGGPSAASVLAQVDALRTLLQAPAVSVPERD